MRSLDAREPPQIERQIESSVLTVKTVKSSEAFEHDEAASCRAELSYKSRQSHQCARFILIHMVAPGTKLRGFLYLQPFETSATSSRYSMIRKPLHSNHEQVF